MTNDESRALGRHGADDPRDLLSRRFSTFGLRHSSVIYHLAFVILAGCPSASRQEVASRDEVSGQPVADSHTSAPPDAQVGDAVTFAPLLEQIEMWGGEVEFDNAGRLIGVDLLGASLSDADVEQLATLTNLKRLQLKGAEITDASVPHLTRFEQLRELEVSKTGVSEVGLVELKKALPQTKIAD